MLRGSFSRALRRGAAGTGAGLVASYGLGYRPGVARCEEAGGAASFDFNKIFQSIGMEKTPDWLSQENVQPLAGGVSFGTATGFASGYAAKKISRVAVVGVGGLFILFQTAAHFKYITINWKKVEEDVTKALDTNGDGKIDDKDAGIWLQKVLDVLATDELQGQAAKNGATGGFAAAFLLGLRKG